MKFQEQSSGAVTVLKPCGPLLAPDAPDFKSRLATLSTRTLGRVVVDLCDVPYVDSAGLEALLDATEEMNRTGQSLKLCAASKTLREVLNLTDLAPLFDHYEDVNSAVRSFL